jgi:hypothetical protein
MTEATLKKLRRARDDAGVVITTPTAIKALLLRYIENATMIRERATKSSLANDRRYAKFIANQDKIVDALHIFVTQGILLCDEIDMLLHPLRSELNFPIGEKFPLDFAPSRWNYPMTVCIQKSRSRKISEYLEIPVIFVILLAFRSSMPSWLLNA